MIVEVSGVTKRFGERVAVDDLTLNVPRGVCFGLLGPNGAGKTTTLRMIYGVTLPTSGQVRVFGMDVSRNVRAVRRRLGVTLQQNVLIETLSPRANLAIFGRYHLMDGAGLARRVEELIDFMELRSHADVPVANLSGGYQRRLAVALSLMNRPELLILDEPTTGLDPAVRLALWSRVRDLRRDGATVLLTTHYMDEAQRLCDTVAIMSAGDIIAQGAPEDLMERYLARQAVELDATPEQEHALLRGLDDSPPRYRSGNRSMIYLDDPAPLLERIRLGLGAGAGARAVAVRPTNLEDVFLTLTGTRLEEGP